MSFGFGLCLPSLNYVASLFSPLSLFANGEQGAWYDPSDLTTLFQDSAGTTPVTAVEQPVGLMLDKSKGLVLGAQLVTGATFTANSANTVGIVNGATFTSAAAGSNASFPAGVTPGRFYEVTYTVSGLTTGGVYVDLGGNSAAITRTANGTYTDRKAASGNTNFYVGASSASTTATITVSSIREIPGNHAFQSTSASRPVLSARVNLLTATNVLSTQSVTTVATTYKLFFAGTGAITLTGTATGVYTAGTYTVTCTAGTLIATVAGLVTQADLRVSNDGVGLPAYQRVNTSTDYDTAGFPLYLKTDGVDDWMQTNSINFTSTDKMTVWAGVRKLSDAASVIAELSASAATNNGAFLFAHNGTGAPTGYNSVFRGTSGVDFGANGYVGPTTNVLTGTGDISGDSATLRINGTQAASSTADLGTGNFGNYPLYLFRRGGTLFPFNGRMYGLIVRGAQSTASQIASGETYMNQKSKAY